MIQSIFYLNVSEKLKFNSNFFIITIIYLLWKLDNKSISMVAFVYIIRYKISIKEFYILLFEKYCMNMTRLLIDRKKKTG